MRAKRLLPVAELWEMSGRDSTSAKKGDYEMWNEELLLNVCKEHCYQNAENVIVPEPYLPYVPENWNGILVLAESQMIGEKDNYARWLQELKSKPEHVMTRLGRKEPTPPYPNKPKKIGIGPWDDGTIKLALQAIFEGANLNLKLEDVAVSNAVPWTYKGVDKNLNPDDEMQTKNKMEAKAVEFWEEIFDVWQPNIKAMVILGNVAERVMHNAKILGKYEKKCLRLRLPSPKAINRVSGMFCCDDLKTRFPEVQKALDALEKDEELRKQLEKQYKMKVFFACHAVSLGVTKFKECFGRVNE